MGIHNFHKWIKEVYPAAFKTKWLHSYDNCYIDINFALHHCSYNAKDIDDIYSKLFCFIIDVLHITMPRKSLIISADGAAPLSKLLLQRERRLTKSKSDNSDSIDHISSIMFTPGTFFMNSLHKKLLNMIDFIEKVYNIYVDCDVDSYDEAELKLKNKMMNNIKKNHNDSHIIVTNDADVVVMLMTLDDVSRTYIYEKSFQNSEIISIGELLYEHIKNIGCSLHPHLDFAAVSILLGNDYLPKIGYATFEKIWISYKECLACDKRGLILDKNLQINSSFFQSLLLGIVKRTAYHFIKKIDVLNIFSSLYDNYMDGYTWCLHTYYNGFCDRYNFMYGFANPPHPLGLAMSIKKNPSMLIKSNEKYPPIKTMAYAILALPYKSKNYIDSKYHDFIENCPILYEQENCQRCNELYSNIDTDKSDISLKKTYSIHKKSHRTLMFDDVDKIIKKFDKFEETIS